LQDEQITRWTQSSLNYEGVYMQHETGYGFIRTILPSHRAPHLHELPLSGRYVRFDAGLNVLPDWSANNAGSMTFNNFVAIGSFNGPNTPGLQRFVER
jgi:hypothetical protein